MTGDPPRRSKLAVELGTRQRPALVRWCTWREGYRGGYDSYILFTSQGPVVLDPEAPDEATTDALVDMAGEQPAATILTNDMHERAAYDVRARWGVPVWAPRTGEADLEGKPNHLYAPGDTLPGGLRAFDLRGRFSGDSALLWTAPTGERVLFTGDTLCGAICPDNPNNAEHPRHAPGLYLGAGPFYLQLKDPEALKASLRPLLDLEFDLICGAHGVPVPNGRALLAGLLDLDWPPLLASGTHPYVPLSAVSSGHR